MFADTVQMNRDIFFGQRLVAYQIDIGNLVKNCIDTTLVMGNNLMFLKMIQSTLSDNICVKYFPMSLNGEHIII